MQQIDTKTQLLKKIYDAYHTYAASWDVACQKYCADCCTRNVTATTLEAHLVITHLLAHYKDKQHLLERCREMAGLPKYEPQVTTNGMAMRCAEGKPLPEEHSDPSWRPCPFLENDACAIYDVRPFGCRCFISSNRCADTGHADVDPFHMSVHTVVLQTIEHVDITGGTGNLIDAVNWLAEERHREAYLNHGLGHPQPGMLPNVPLRILMVPENHRLRIEPFLGLLRQIKPEP